MPIDLRHETEAHIREVLAQAGLPAPDEIVYGEGGITLLWHEQKLCITIDDIPRDEADDVDGSAADDDLPF